MASVVSQMPGKIVEIKVKAGDTVAEGQELCVIEAMKMQMPVMSAHNGSVKEVKVEVGQGVKKGDVLVEIE